LARWLSEGGAEDGAAAEDTGASSEFAAPVALEEDTDVLPARTPAPTGATVQLAGEVDLPAMIASTSEHEERVHATTEETLSDEPMQPLSQPDAGRSLASPDTLSLDACQVPQKSAQSAHETLGTVHPPVPEPTRESSNEFAKPPDTLKGVRVDNLFPTSDLQADEARPRMEGNDTGTVQGSADARPTKPLGLAERLLSEDSEVRASAMHEAISEEDGRVAGRQSSERNTREYGNPIPDTAGLVQEVVSAIRETAHPSLQPIQPERPTKEVDWGAWPTRTALSPQATDDTAVVVDQLPDHDRQGPALAENASTAEAGSALPAPLSVEHPVIEAPTPADQEVPPQPPLAESHAEPLAASAAPAGAASSSSAHAHATGVLASKGGEVLPDRVSAYTSVDPSLTLSRPRPAIAAASSRAARRVGQVQVLWLLAIGASAVVAVGSLALRGKASPPVEPALAAAQPSIETASPPRPASAPIEAMAAAVARSSPGLAPTEKPEKGALRPGIGLALPALADVRRKCLEIDADGKGKAKAVAAACRPALAGDPKDVDVMVILARAQIDRGRLNEARALAKQALATNPQR